MSVRKLPPLPLEGPESSIADHIATFLDNTGETVKDSGRKVSDPSYFWQSEAPAQSGLHKRFYVDRAGTILEVRPNVVRGDGSATMQLDILKNGATIYPAATKPNVAAAGFVNGSFVPDTTAFADGDYFQINVLNNGGTLGAIRVVIKFKES